MKEDSKQGLHSLTILSLHWGFSLGGVGKYATLIESVGSHESVQIKSICIIGYDWQTDESNLKQIDVEKIFIKSRFDLSWISHVSSYIEQYNPDLLMTHGFNGHFVALVARVSNQIKIPVVCSYHGLYHATTFTRQFFGVLFNKVTELFLRNIATGVVCVADYSKNYLSTKGVNPEKLTVIHNGINDKMPDESKRMALRKEWAVKDNELLLGVASRLDPVKGIVFLIEALGKVQKFNPYIKLVIIGTGTLDQQLRKQVEQLNLKNNVIFTGYRTDINQCLGAIDIFMLPSLSENHSIAILEAMRARKAIIATDVGGNTESVRDNKEALIVLPNDSACLAEAIKKLITNKALRDKLANKARDRFLQEFTVETMVRKTADWLIACGKKAGTYKENSA